MNLDLSESSEKHLVKNVILGRGKVVGERDGHMYREREIKKMHEFRLKKYCEKR